ncbi:tetratricopeptide repeat protein, partial [Planktotalea sp.]
VTTALIRFYVGRNRLDDAETYLRENSDPADEDPANFVALLQLVEQTKGKEALLAELESAIAAGGGNAVLYRGLKANLKFLQGDQEDAISDLNAVLAEDLPTSENLRNIKVMLARMENIVGNNVGARRLIEEVLAEDSGQSEALHMQARWLIDADEIDTAISSLRAALQASDRDTTAMTLMAEAYTRAGDHELALDFLARAAEASDNAPAETLRYAGRLVEDDRYTTAEDQLLLALRSDPRSLTVMTELGQLYLLMEDNARARQVIKSMNDLDTAQSRNAARALDLSVRARSGDMDTVIATLENMAEDTDNPNGQAAITIIRAHLANGKGAEAVAYARNFLEKNPRDSTMHYVLATTLAAIGQPKEAEERYRALLDDFPKQHQLRLALLRLMSTQGRNAEGEVLVDDGLALTPDQPELLWAKASYLERGGDVDAAIEIYETLYTLNSGSIVVANNLASLLSTYRDDAESNDRAYTVARRLRGTEIPAFQDTYGWLAYKRGEYVEAVEYLEAAAAGLPDDPMVQAHLGFTYQALERNEDALEMLQRAVEIAGEDDQRDRIKQARAEIEALTAALAE